MYSGIILPRFPTAKLTTHTQDDLPIYAATAERLSSYRKSIFPEAVCCYGGGRSD